ncbi:hypothetical protein H6G36_28190 [Anabaena minutissima FACHB-250]|nr:hypothetical protein [Anabaena minutissima FACHB-250]
MPTIRHKLIKEIKQLSIATLSCLVLMEFASTSIVLSNIKEIPTNYELAQATSQLVKTQKRIYKPSEPITVEFAGLPGHKTDWITIVGAAVPDNTYDEWYYTDGKQSGYMSFKGLPAGNYEVRVYFNWSQGAYVVQDRYKFSVSD